MHRVEGFGDQKRGAMGIAIEEGGIGVMGGLMGGEVVAGMTVGIADVETACGTSSSRQCKVFFFITDEGMISWEP